nr:glycosyltransferase [Enterovirga sp. DB1703]
MAALVKESAPNLLILRSPIRPVLLWAALNRVRTLVLLADSFDRSSLKSRLSQYLLSGFLRLPNVDWVANHGLRAAEQLVSAGVPARKVLPWDYPALDSPHGRPAKTQAGSAGRLLYVGLMTEAKGVDDLIEAVALLKAQGRAVHLDLIGRPDDGRLAQLIAARDLGAEVTQVGLVSNAEIVGRMRQADVVVVPSRHEYSEGIPLTIYEAYCSRTPLVVSDHPMFLGNVVDGESGLVFQAGRRDGLASSIARLLDDPPLYARISAASASAWERLQIPLKWDRLIDDWLENSPESRARLASHSLARTSVAARPA